MNKTPLTNQELREFEKSTLPFYEERVVGGKKCRLFKQDEFMRANRAMRFDGIYWTICALPLYLELEGKLEQLRKYKSKIAFAKQKELEAAEQYA